MRTIDILSGKSSTESQERQIIAGYAMANCQLRETIASPTLRFHLETNVIRYADSLINGVRV